MYSATEAGGEGEGMKNGWWENPVLVAQAPGSAGQH